MRLHGVALLWAMALPVGAAEAPTPKRLDEVIQRGLHVMPFDLEKTQHFFTETPAGGVQQVIAKEAGDQDQIRLIRQHLAAIASRFSQGDFSGPREIHGPDMPGLAELQAGAQQVRFNYRELPQGAEIDYVTQDAQLVAAIHRFFQAQLSDHGRHAVSGHAGHHP
jgi:hypothetical protein